MSEVLVSVLPLMGSPDGQHRTIKLPITINDWESADDPYKTVCVRTCAKDGDYLKPGNGLKLSPGEAYMLCRALTEYFKQNGSHADDDQTGVVCIAERSSG